MVKTLILSSVLVLTGCATNCTDHCVAGFGPGTKAFDVIANHYNSMDPCQSKDMPSFCGSNKDKVIRVIKGTGNSYIIKQQ